MSVDLECPSCWKSLQFDDNQSGAQVRCPHCLAEFTLPNSEPGYGLANPLLCPSCNADLPRDAVLCTRCGYDFRTDKKRKQRAEEKEFRHSAENATYTIRRDERGRWYLESIGRVLKLLSVKPAVYAVQVIR
jgi:predicted amidophosphoribosyltransferase